MCWGWPDGIEPRKIAQWSLFSTLSRAIASPMDTTAADYDPLYLEGIAFFNKCDFFEAHDAWEELWTEYRGELRQFYQGLIQAAVALHHFGNGNIRGARKVYVSSRSYLAPYRPVCAGLDLDKFLSEFDLCFSEVMKSPDEFPEIEIDPERIPEIMLNPPAELPIVGDER